MPIDWGARLTGRMGGWDVGVLRVATAELQRDSATVPGNAFTVARLTAAMNFTRFRPSRMEAEFSLAALPRVREFLAAFASRSGWDVRRSTASTPSARKRC